MSTSRWSIRSLAAMGLLCAVSVVLGTVLSIKAIPLAGTYTVNIALNLLPVQFAGLLFGPLAGLAVGSAADFLKWALIPLGAYHPGFTVSMGMMGFVPALAVQLLQGRGVRFAHEPLRGFLEETRFWQLLVGVGVAQVLFSVGLNSYWLSMMQGRAVLALLPPRLVNAFVMIPVYSFLLQQCARLAPQAGFIFTSHR